MDQGIRSSWGGLPAGVLLLAFVALAAAAGRPAGPKPVGNEETQRSLAPSALVKAVNFKEELSIGVPEGEEEYMFGSSVVFNVDDGGRVYATDGDSKQVKVFDPDGKHVLTFGRQGQGPGEFQNPGVVRFAKDGTLYLSEGFRNKLIFFDGHGVFLRQNILPADIFDIWITPAGTYLGSEQAAPQYVGQGPVENFIRVYDRNFKSILELHRDSFIFPDRSLTPAQAQAAITNEFLARPTALAVMGEKGLIYFGRSDRYAVDIFRPDGAKLSTISRDVPPLPYKKADKDFILKEYEENMNSMMKSEALTKEYLSLIRFPESKPFFRALVPMEEGGLAVVVDIEGFTATWLDLFDGEGRFLGRVRAAVPMLNLIFKNGKAYALQRDDSGFLSIKRYGFEMSR